MDIEQFWEIIDAARKDAGDWEDMADPLVERLAALDVDEILLWKNIFDEYQSLSYKSKLWAAAYVINGGCSDDGFDYFRGWLTAQGKKIFLKALKDPDSLANVETAEGDVEFERMLGIAADAYSRKTGKDSDCFYVEPAQLPDAMKQAMLSEIEYARDIDVEWEEDDLEKLLPKLSEAFD